MIETLVFHKTTGFRHTSIPAGIEALAGLGDQRGFAVTATEEAGVFGASDLDRYEVIVFLNTTGDVLDQRQQAAMEAFIRAGKGFVGVHAAADTEYEWEWYGNLLGTYFEGHPDPQSAVVRFSDAGQHPVTKAMPAEIEIRDEWYNFREAPDSGITTLATLDESSYEGGTMGGNHPIAWAHDYDGGRSVYIGFGHFDESFDDPFVKELLANAVVWAGGQENP